MAQGIIIPADNSASLTAATFATLGDYQRVVGGWIEAVDIPDLGVTMYVNEEGLIRSLLYNRRATFLWCYHVPHARGQAQLAGDAVPVGLPNHKGVTTDIPPATRDLLLGETLCQVEMQRLHSDQWRPTPSEPQRYIEAVVGAKLTMECAPGARYGSWLRATARRAGRDRSSHV